MVSHIPASLTLCLECLHTESLPPLLSLVVRGKEQTVGLEPLHAGVQQQR